MPLLEGLGREIPETGVQTLSIVVDFDVFEYRFLCVLACREAFSVDGLDLQAVVPSLHGGVVVTVTLLTHARDEAIGSQETAIVVRAVLSLGLSGEPMFAQALAPRIWESATLQLVAQHLGNYR